MAYCVYFQLTWYFYLRTHCPWALNSCPGGHCLMGAHLYEPLVFSHLVPRRQECWPLEHSSTSRDSNYINQGGNQDCTHGPGCSKLG